MYLGYAITCVGAGLEIIVLTRKYACRSVHWVYMIQSNDKGGDLIIKRTSMLAVFLAINYKLHRLPILLLPLRERFLQRSWP